MNHYIVENKQIYDSIKLKRNQRAENLGKFPDKLNYFS
jgi:hypothetical protein